MSDTHAQTVAYVRDTMLPETDPPVTEAGAIKWLRENLFSGWLNIILTIVSVYVVFYILSHLLPWFLHTVWNAGSLTECREIRNATWGEDASSACFAVIKARWHQLIFGFYPQHLYWRPVVALVIFFVAIAPVLFQSVPRKALWFTAVAPFLMFFFLWGGTIWGPIMVALGFVVGWAALRYISPIAGNLAGVLAMFLLPIIYWLFLAGPLISGLGAILPSGWNSSDPTISAASPCRSSSAFRGSSCRCRWASFWPWAGSRICSSSTRSRWPSSRSSGVCR